MHLHIGLVEFLIFALYYVILKAFIHFVQLESRRTGMKTVAGVTGLLA